MKNDGKPCNERRGFHVHRSRKQFPVELSSDPLEKQTPKPTGYRQLKSNMTMTTTPPILYACPSNST